MIPKKLYYSISEVCSLTELEQHVLRYWESEFPQLKPKKNRAGNRAYREKDIEVIKYIKHLLYEEKFTITGAKKKLVESKNPPELEAEIEHTADIISAVVVNNDTPKDQPEQLELPLVIIPKEIDSIKKELRSILEYLQSDITKFAQKN